MGRFRNQGVETVRFRGGDGGFRNQGWRWVGLEIMGWRRLG